MKSSNEIRLIFLCSNPSVDLQQEKEIAHLLSKEINWDELIKRASELGVILIVYTQLQKKFSDKIPDYANTKMRTFFYQNTARNMVYSKILIQLIQLFEENQILAVPFKGPVLSDMLFGNESLRQFGDLDIFIQPFDITRARDLLFSKGYQLVQNIPDGYETLYFDIDHALDFFHPGTRNRVDLQWKLFRIYTIYPITLVDLKQRAVNVEFYGKKLLSLGNEDLLFFLCAHGSKHHWERLEYITCVSELVRKKNDLDWQYVFTMAEKQGCKKMVLLGLYLARSVYETPLPETVMAELNNNTKILKLSQKIIESYIHSRSISSRYTNNLDLSFFQLQIRDNIKARVIFGIRALTKPSIKELELIKLPFSFYYLLKPARLTYRLMALLWPFKKA